MTRRRSNWSAVWPLVLGFLTIFVLLGGLGAWSVLTTLSGAIIANGKIEVSLRRQVVQHPDGGVVSEIFVSEGSRVAKGAVLMRLDDGILRSELSIAESALMELDARRSRLEAQSNELPAIRFSELMLMAAKAKPSAVEIMEGQKSLFEKQAEALAQAKELRLTQIEQIRNQIIGITAQHDAIKTQIELLTVDLETQKGLLAQGLTQSARVSAIARELADLQGRLGELVSEQAKAAGRITEIEIEITALSTRQREQAEGELRDLVAREREMRERAAALRRQIGRLELRAPVSGVVLGLQVSTVNSVILPAENLMYIVPQDRPLFVAARVPVTQIDEVHVDQEVHLVFSSLPSRTTPQIEGKVTGVSADAFSDEQTGAAYYRVEIAIDQASFKALEGVQVLPGMPVSTYFKTNERTPLSYLLKPFEDYFRNAFRES